MPRSGHDVGHDFHCEVGGVKAPGTPWRKLPSSGPFAISGMRRAPVKQYKFLEREGAKFHLRTRAQMHGKKVAKLRKAAKKEARKIKRKLAKRAVRGREYAPLSTPAAEALANALRRTDGLTEFSDEMRSRMTNNYHIGVRLHGQTVGLPLGTPL